MILRLLAPRTLVFYDFYVIANQPYLVTIKAPERRHFEQVKAG